MLSLIGPEMKLYNQDESSQNFSIPQCALLPLLRRKTSFPWPLIVTPLTTLPPNLVSANPLSSGFSKNFFPTDKLLLLVILASFLLLPNALSSLKSLLARLPMLFRSPTTSTPPSPIQSPQKQSEGFSKNTHSRLW